MSYLDNDGGIGARIARDRRIAPLLAWWSAYSGYVIIPAGLLFFALIVYEMVHDVI